MTAFGTWLGTQGLKFLGWVGLNVFLPWAQKKAAVLHAKIKAAQAHKKEVKDAEIKNEEYENNPSDDTFGNSH